MEIQSNNILFVLLDAVAHKLADIHTCLTHSHMLAQCVMHTCLHKCTHAWLPAPPAAHFHWQWSARTLCVCIPPPNTNTHKISQIDCAVHYSQCNSALHILSFPILCIFFNYNLYGSSVGESLLYSCPLSFSVRPIYFTCEISVEPTVAVMRP